MEPIRLLLLTAVVPEAQALLRGLRLTNVAAPVPFWRGTLGNPGEPLPIALAVVGVRASRLDALSDWLANTPVEAIIMAGLAGALAPDLRVGDVVVDPQNLPPPQGLASARIAPVFTCDKLVATPAEKSHLFATTRCAAVEMETAIVRQWAMERHLPFIAIRGISDAADDPLDPRLVSLIDPLGHVRLGRVFAMLAKNPFALREMLRLQKNSALAMANVARVFDELLASGWPVKNTYMKSAPDALSGKKPRNRPSVCEE